MRTKTMDENSQIKINKTPFNKKRFLFIVGMLAIPCINWVVFWLIMNLQSILMAFQSPADGSWSFINFIDLWTNINKQEITINAVNSVRYAFRNTLTYFGVSLFICVPLCLVVAFFIYKRIWGYGFFRVVFYLPTVVSAVAMVVGFEELVKPSGPIFTIIKSLGGTVDGSYVLVNQDTAMLYVQIYHVFTSLTTNVLLFSSAMTRIPIEVLEASKLDGVGPARELVQIIFPLIWATFSTQMLFLFTGFFNSSGPILLFPEATRTYVGTLNYWIFNQVYSAQHYNISACAGFCCTLIGVPIILIIRKIIDKIDTVEY